MEKKQKEEFDKPGGTGEQVADIQKRIDAEYEAQKKKGYNFLSYKEREIILTSNRFIDRVNKATDKDDTVVNNLKEFVKNGLEFVFANGGDRIPTTTPEMAYCFEHNIPMLFNIGGVKTESSSKIIRNLLDQATK